MTRQIARQLNISNYFDCLLCRNSTSIKVIIFTHYLSLTRIDAGTSTALAVMRQPWRNFAPEAGSFDLIIVTSQSDQPQISPSYARQMPSRERNQGIADGDRRPTAPSIDLGLS